MTANEVIKEIVYDGQIITVKELKGILIDSASDNNTRSCRITFVDGYEMVPSIRELKSSWQRMRLFLALLSV